MSKADSGATLVARFLKANGYTQSFEAFIEEAGLSEEDGNTSVGDLTVEKLLDEKRVFDKSISFEKLSLNDQSNLGWIEPAPSYSNEVSTAHGAANILSVIVQDIDASKQQAILTSASDKSVKGVNIPSLERLDNLSITLDAPILSQTTLRHRYHIATTMSGGLCISSLTNGKVLHQQKAHSKFAISVISYEDTNHTFIATAGWDKKVNLYTFEGPDNVEDSVLGEPAASIELETKPEAIQFVCHPDTLQPVLIVTRTDSSYLHFFDVRDKLQPIGKQNLAPYSNAWVAFTPSSIAVNPMDSGVVAVATNSIPHMRVLIVRLLIVMEPTTSTVGSQSSIEKARAEQALADQEHSAIMLHCNAMAPQSPFSTPLVVWRPCGTGVWVNSDDGVIRGIHTKSGKVVQELKGHLQGSKVRALWAGWIRTGPEERDQEEWVVSGGFDHKLFVWKTATS